jgi:sec-independent protein translocase protein TatB
MFEIGWSELLVIAVVAILVVGPKELPRMLRTFGGMLGKMRRMAGEFQSQFNDVLREAERQADLDDIKKQVEAVKSIDPLKDVRTSLTDAVSTPSKPLPPPVNPVPAASSAPVLQAGTTVPAEAETAAPLPVASPAEATSVSTPDPVTPPQPLPVPQAPQPMATADAPDAPKSASGGGGA